MDEAERTTQVEREREGRLVYVPVIRMNDKALPSGSRLRAVPEKFTPSAQLSFQQPQMALPRAALAGVLSNLPNLIPFIFRRRLITTTFSSSPSSTIHLPKLSCFLQLIGGTDRQRELALYIIVLVFLTE